MRIKDFTDTIRHLTDPFNIPQARRMIAESPALTQEQFKAGGIVEQGVTHYGKTKKEIAAIENLKKGKEGRRLHNITQQEKAWDVIAEAMQQADIHNDMEYLMANEHSTGWRKGYEKGMLKYRDTLNKLQTNPYGIEYVAKKLGEKPEWVLDMVEESKDFAQGERTPIKDTRIKSDFAKAERWLVNNGSRYADPDKFKKAFIKRFGKNNAFISGAGREPNFSLKFISEFLSDKPGKLSTTTIDNIFKTAIYNLNPTVRDKIVKTLTDFESMKPMRSRGAVRDWMNSQKILVKFGINEKINGPISRLIQKSIGDEAYKNIQTLRRPYNNTVEMLDYYASKASPKYKKMFTETAEALRSASAGDWKLSASQLKKADKIMYDHKVPSSFIDAGYADEINRAKVVPTSKNFNMEIKMREFDAPMMRLFNKYKNAQPFEKKGILEDIRTKKENFSRKYGRYLDDVSIDVDKKGKLKMSSTAEVVTKDTDLAKSLQTSLAQEKFPTMNNKQQMNFFKKMGYRCRRAGGGEETVACYMDDVKKTRADMKSSNVEVRAKALTKQRKALQLASKMPQIGKILKTGLQMGTAGLAGFLNWTGVGQPIAYAIEGLVEGGFYDNARRKGYSHEQAMAETFTLGLIAGRPEGVPWHGGSEKLREKELYEIKGKNEFIDVENRPSMQDPTFGKVIGTRGKVKQYIDARHEQDRIYDLIGKKEALKDQPTTTDETLFIPGDLDAASADVQDLARSGAYRRVDQTLKPESMASQAYETAVEQRLGKDLQRKKEYLEEYDPGALEREEKILSRPRQLEKRYRQMEGMYPTLTNEIIDDMLKQQGATIDDFRRQDIDYDDLRYFYKLDLQREDIARAGGVANMAEGGIASLKK
jgi:hypothetical protein